MAKNNITKYLLIGGAVYAAYYLSKNKSINQIGTIKKSKAASQVLKLMDNDYTYQEALKIVLALNFGISKIKLEKELNKFI